MWPFRKSAPSASVTTVPRVSRQPRARNYSAVLPLARYGDMVSSFGSADYELSAALATLRSKSRYLARNSGTMKRYRQLLRDNVIGDEGFTFQARTRRADGALDKSLNDRVEAEWADFWDQPTTDGFSSGTELLHLAVSSWTTDGEIIWEIVLDRAYPSGFKINPIEADLLDETLTTKAPNGNQIKMGVEIDARGQHVAYWFLTDHPGDLVLTGGSSSRNRHRRIPSEFVIHVYDMTRPGQTRGEPPASSAINPIKMQDGYREAEVMGRRLRAAVMGFFKKMLPKAQGIATLSDGVGTERGDDELMEMSVEPGMFRELPDGLEFQEFSPGGWTSDFAQADGQFKKEISMGLGISNFSLGMETAGVSYSTGRSVLIEDRDHYRRMQKFLIRRLMKPLFRTWAKYRSLQTASAVPPSKWTVVISTAMFRPRGWDWVDPTKDVNANSEALKTGQTTLTRIAASRGVEFSDMLDEIADENAALQEKLGIQHPFVSAIIASLPPEPTPDTNDANSDGGADEEQP